MKNKLDVLQKTARAWEEKVPNNDSGDKEESMKDAAKDKKEGSDESDKNVDEIKEALERDNFMTPDTAKSFGLIDKVVEKRE